MRKSFWVVLLIGVFRSSLPVQAQVETPKFEEYGGYDYIRFKINAKVKGVSPSASYNSSGGSGQLEYNMNRYLGIVGDLGGSVVTEGTPVAATFSYLFGPRINLRRGKFTPFSQVLLGGLAATAEIGHPGAANHFTMTAGGGIDFKVSKLIAIRPVQAEYFMTRFPDGLHNRQDNFR